MLQKHPPGEKALRFFGRKKITTLDELGQHLQCSRRTVQRRLIDWQAIKSYNQNSRYFTLPHIPDFDPNGLWRHREVFFSRFGNLPQTLVGLVHNAPAGLTAAELGELLSLRSSSFMWAFRDHPDLKREKRQGIYVYFDSASGRHAEQRQRRAVMIKSTRRLAEFEAIAILVEKIKHPKMNAEELSRRLRRKRVRVEPEMIRDLLTRQGLAGKKGAPGSS